MIFKFDILFKKKLASGSIKVVTYSQLLENPKAFGENETLEGAVGELSVVKNGSEKGFSLNSLLRKYHVQLVGRKNAEKWGKEMPIRFVFGDDSDVESVQIILVDSRGEVHTFKSEIQAEVFMDLSNQDSFVAVVATKGTITLSDDNDNNLLNLGEVGFVSASTGSINLNSKNYKLIYISI